MLFMSTGRTTLTFVGRLKKLIGRPTAHEDGFNETTRSSTLSYAMRSTTTRDDSLKMVTQIYNHISQPSLTRPRKLVKPQESDQSQIGQSKFVDQLLSGRRNGFFVEYGAVDGEYLSNSLFFELERNWTGLLIEANPNYHRTLLDKNRPAYVMNACLSPEPRPMTALTAP